MRPLTAERRAARTALSATNGKYKKVTTTAETRMIQVSSSQKEAIVIRRLAMAMDL